MLEPESAENGSAKSDMQPFLFVADLEVPQRMRTPSGSLLQDINPLIYLSPDDKNNMEDEVEKILSDDNGKCVRLVEHFFHTFVVS